MEDGGACGCTEYLAPDQEEMRERLKRELWAPEPGSPMDKSAAQPVSAPSPEIPDDELAQRLIRNTKGWMQERITELESALRAAREELYHAFVSGAKWWEFDSTKGTMWPSDQERVRAAAVERYPYCPHPLLREKEIELAAERDARKQAEVEQFNAGIEAAAKECDQFVEAYSFWTPYPDGYAYSDVESKAAALFAKGRFEVAARKIRELEPVSGSPERFRGEAMNEIKIEFRGNWMELANEDRRILKDIADLVDQFNARRQADTALPAEPTPEPAQGRQQS